MSTIAQHGTKSTPWIMHGLCALVVALLLLSSASMPAMAKEKLVIWSIGSETGAYGKVLGQLTPALEAQFPDLDIEIQYVTGPTERFITHHLGGVAPDIVTLQTNAAPALIAQGLLVPIDRDVFGVGSDDELKDLFYKGSLPSMYHDDNVYFIPNEVTTMGVIANVDLLSAAGLPADVPATWEELAAQAKKVTRFDNDGALTTPGMAINRGWIWPTFYWPSFIRQSGFDWIENDQPQFANPAVIDNLAFYQSLYYDNQVMLPTSGATDFLNGNAGYYLGLQYELFDFYDPEQVTFEWTTGAYPYFENGERVSLSYAWGMYVYSGSKLQREAWEVIEFLTNEDHAPMWYADSSLLIPRDGAWIIDLVNEDPRRAVFIEELEHAQMEIAHIHGGDIRAAINQADIRLIGEGQNVGNVMRMLNEEAKVILSQQLE